MCGKNLPPTFTSHGGTARAMAANALWIVVNGRHYHSQLEKRWS